MTISLDDIRSAAAALAGDLTVTPTIPSPRLSEQTGCRIHLKLESLHHTGSFKERGALNKLKSLSRGRSGAGRHRHVRRQPRPGRRLPRHPARHPGDHRHAGADALHQGGADRGLRRPGRFCMARR